MTIVLPPLWSSQVETRIRAEAKNLDEQTRPQDVQMCVRCVVTNQRPRITFDKDGLCSACQYADRKRLDIDWEGREWQLMELLDKHRKPNGYDVIVPSSGGKDSAFVAWTLKHKYGMRPLCVTWAPFLATEIGRQNLDSFTQAGFDTIIAQPNGLTHRRLSRLSLEYYGDNFIPFIFGQLCWPLHAAAKFGVKLVFFGECGELEYGGDISVEGKPFWDKQDWDRIYSKGATVRKLLAIGQGLGAFEPDESLSPFYSLPLQSQMEDIEMHWLGHYLPWHPHANFELAFEKTGFRPCEQRSEGTFTKMSSLDDKLDAIHYRMSFVKFGIGRATSDAAQQIRAGDITREEGLALVKRYDSEWPSRYIGDSLAYLGLNSMSHYLKIEDRFSRSLYNIMRLGDDRIISALEKCSASD